MLPTRPLILAVAATVGLSVFPVSAVARGFSLGILDPLALNPPTAADGDLVFGRIKSAGARYVRTSVDWTAIAPSGDTRPAGFNARNPADPHYSWAVLDTFMRTATAQGLTPIVTTLSAPYWAQGPGREGAGPAWRPQPSDYKDFGIALAKRYSGTFADPAMPGQTLPRLRYYQAWNEPNFNRYLEPLKVGDKVIGPGMYVNLLNAFYDGVKGVNGSNKVLGAGMGPFGYNGDNRDMDPQVFIRAAFCLQGTPVHQTRMRHCGHALPKFDIWTQHPYTLEGTPTTAGVSPDAGAMGNVREIKRTLDRAAALKTLGVRGRRPLWITELDWMSDPPGYMNLGKPVGLQAQYLSEAAYRLWRWGASVMIWYELRDQKQVENAGAWPGGLYFAGDAIADDRAKPALRAFQLPFYAERTGNGVYLWALVDGGGRTRLAVERMAKGRWHRVATLTTDRDGVLSARIARPVKATYRVRSLSGRRSGLISWPYPSG